MPLQPSFSPNNPLLIPDEPIQFLPMLGAVIGSKEAIFLQKIQDDLVDSPIVEDGRKWLSVSLDEIHLELYCFSKALIKRISLKLRNFTFQGKKSPILLVKRKKNTPENWQDRTCLYSVNYEALNELLPVARDFAEKRKKEIEARMPESVRAEMADIHMRDMLSLAASMPILNT